MKTFKSLKLFSPSLKTVILVRCYMIYFSQYFSDIYIGVERCGSALKQICESSAQIVPELTTSLQNIWWTWTHEKTFSVHRCCLQSNKPNMNPQKCSIIQCFYVENNSGYHWRKLETLHCCRSYLTASTYTVGFSMLCWLAVELALVISAYIMKYLLHEWMNWLILVSFL